MVLVLACIDLGLLGKAASKLIKAIQCCIKTDFVGVLFDMDLARRGLLPKQQERVCADVSKVQEQLNIGEEAVNGRIGCPVLQVASHSESGWPSDNHTIEVVPRMRQQRVDLLLAATPAEAIQVAGQIYAPPSQ